MFLFPTSVHYTYRPVKHQSLENRKLFVDKGLGIAGRPPFYMLHQRTFYAPVLAHHATLLRTWCKPSTEILPAKRALLAHKTRSGLALGDGYWFVLLMVRM